MTYDSELNKYLNHGHSEYAKVSELRDLKRELTKISSLLSSSSKNTYVTHKELKPFLEKTLQIIETIKRKNGGSYNDSNLKTRLSAIEGFITNLDIPTISTRSNDTDYETLRINLIATTRDFISLLSTKASKDHKHDEYALKEDLDKLKEESKKRQKNMQDQEYATLMHNHKITDIKGLNETLGNKQDTLVSGTNIKTVNGTTLLGSGNLVVGGSVDSVFTRTGAVVAASGDYTATQITNTPAGNIAAVTVQDAINELDTEKASTSHTHAASAITNTPAGNIAATTVQAAINELDTEKEPVQTKGTLTATSPIVLDNSTRQLIGGAAVISHATGSGNNHVPAAGASTQLLQYSSAGTAKWVSASGDATIADGGALTIANNAVTLAKMQTVTTDSLLGRDTAGTGNVEQLTVGGGLEFSGSGGIQRSALTGDVTATAGSNATTIANNAVSLAKMATVATNTVLGRTTAGTGNVEALSINAANGIPKLNASTQLTQTAIGELYANNDGLSQTARNHLNKVPTDTFNTSPSLTWAAYTGFNTPTTTQSSSNYYVYTTAGTAGNSKIFGYYGSYYSNISALCTTGLDNCRAGIRMDDGTMNNYIELFLEFQSSSLLKLRYRQCNGGVTGAITDGWGGGSQPHQYYWLQFARSGNNVFMLAGGNSPFTPFIGTAIFTSWTPTRSGLFVEHPSGGASDVQRAGIFDAVILA